MEVNSLISNPQFFSSVKEADIQQITEDIIPFLFEKIDSTTSFIINKISSNNNKLAKEAFNIEIKQVIYNSIYSYVANKKWELNVPILAYLKKALSSFGQISVKKDIQTTNTITQYVCPACKEFNIKSICVKSDRRLICNNCENSLILEKDIKKKHLFDVFKQHSIAGVKCPKCNKFVPKSCKQENTYVCPYPSCSHSFSDELIKKHPVSVINRIVKTSDCDNATYCDTQNTPLSNLLQKEDVENNFNLIKKLILLQRNANTQSKKIPIKECMYNAFLKTLEQYPNEMINYLMAIHQTKTVPIQPIIYQNFANLLLEKLPLSFYKNGDAIVITNPLDERLYLFNGIRRFTNFIDTSSKVKRIPSLLKNDDSFIEDKDDAFIGKIISATNSHGDDLLDLIENYSFTEVTFAFSQKTKYSEDVTITYYSCVPNYTMGSMIFLQRIKKKLSDSLRKYEAI